MVTNGMDYKTSERSSYRGLTIHKALMDSGKTSKEAYDIVMSMKVDGKKRIKKEWLKYGVVR